MPVALFIAGHFWLAVALVFWFGSEVVQRQPDYYRFLSSTYDSRTWYTWLAVFVLAAVVCFALSYAAWRRQHDEPMRSTGAARAFPVIPASDESGRRH